MEARPKRITKPNPRYVDSFKEIRPVKQIALKNGKESKSDTIVRPSLSASSVAVTFEKGQVKGILDSKPKYILAAEANKSTGNRQLCIKNGNKKRAVKFHFTIDCSEINQIDLAGLGEFIKNKMKTFRKTKIKNMKLIVTSETLFQKSSLKYWTKAYLKQHIERPVEVVVTSKRSFHLNYSVLE